MASNLLSLAGWYFLPSLVTGYIQTTFYTILIRAGDPKPAPGSPRFIQHRRLIQISVIVLYLLYTIYEADHQITSSGNFYTLLSVPHAVEDRALQSRFRRLTVQYHPDKASYADKPAMEDLYIKLKVARDTLADPAKRFAYDRFGPEILTWQNSKSIKDFIYHGTQQLTMYYLGSASVLILLGVLGYLRQGMFWRYVVMTALFVIEVQIATRPTFPAVLTGALNPILSITRLRQPYLPYQLILLLRKLTVTFFIAMSQLGPLLQDPRKTAAGAGAQEGAGAGVTTQQVERVMALTQGVDQEVNRLMALELMPFMDTAASKELRSTTKEWLVQNTVRNDPEVHSAIQRVLDRRRRTEQGEEEH
ncbi:hypothetical protein CLAFUW4_04315 [Fulvia fulva]|uniref:J domain-containing protein n=1 Tax=Passalora fulva TaxID=5499 RepID=A0A9Q8LEE1_PASFU|nr:uncharacterized protein CLAFUR5_04279 [Fulvia fulva]KAK4626464.1 hypothetical protein CLAFUR4_04301 [Fulvia fulva]KAK4628248.1 hypothetical protein CLAFUR0_04303 [Fulvia fulva]UJO15922.1 hypothetical protein CLAFUR5_04279 [Fulvia fulva]WPV14330.1 hypothetical protein CLAFUW4_04315 [Fulvia fulva]WPV28577.1 hypothetical protein CLAFUW7_04304 [Fulvia fulva]